MTALYRILQGIEKTIVKVYGILGTVFFALLTVVMLTQIFMRRVVNRPFVWAEDLNVLLFVWITFMGAAVLFSRKQLISVDMLFTRLPRRTAHIVELVFDVVLLFSSSYGLKLSIDFLKRQIALGHKLGGGLGLPSWAMTAALVASMASILLSSLVFIVREASALGVHEKGEPAHE